MAKAMAWPWATCFWSLANEQEADFHLSEAPVLVLTALFLQILAFLTGQESSRAPPSRCSPVVGKQGQWADTARAWEAACPLAP